MSIEIADSLVLMAIEAGQVNAPAAEAAAEGSNQLDSPQRAAVIGEPVPIVFCKRNEGAGTGGILISPGATEARFENDASNNVTAYYHLVLSEGQLGSIQVRDVFQRSCRIGTYTQTYGRRAGTWTPGNFLVQQTGFDLPEASYYCGSIGLYSGMSTLSFNVTIPDGFDYWNRQVHCFIRNGMQVPRLIEGTTGSSNNFADLVQWCMITSAKMPASLIDTTTLTTAANFLATNNFNCDINISESTNLPDLMAQLSPYFLVTETRVNGKRGLRPLLPINNDYTIKTTALTWKFTFTEEHIIPDTFEISFVPLADRKPFCAQMIWRQQLTDDFGIIRTADVRYVGTAEAGPFEQHDMSAFCTVENHAVKAGAYILARRRYISHTLRIGCRPDAMNAIISAGDIVRVTLSRQSNGASEVDHDFLYEVTRVTKTLQGDLTFDLTHCPVDSQGRSMVAVDVAAAVGTGVLLTSNKTGVSCDINSSSDTTIPAETFTAGEEPYDETTLIPGIGPAVDGGGSGAGGSGGATGAYVGGGNGLYGGGEARPGASTANPLDPMVPQPFESYNGTSSTGNDPIGLGSKIRPAAACPGGSIKTSSWYINNELVATIDVANNEVVYLNSALLGQPNTPQLQLTGIGGDPGSFIMVGPPGTQVYNVMECLDGTRQSSLATMGTGGVPGSGAPGAVVTFQSRYHETCYYPLGFSAGDEVPISYGVPPWYQAGGGTCASFTFYIVNSSGVVVAHSEIAPPRGCPPNLTTPNYCVADGSLPLANQPWTTIPRLTLETVRVNGTVVLDYTAI